MECRTARIAWLASVAVILALTACSTEKKPPPKTEAPESSGFKYEELKFVADPTLLGFVYPDSSLGLRFAPPRGWPPLEPELVAEVQAQFERFAPKDNRFVARPVRIFYEKEKQYFMIISRFPSWPVVMTPEAAIVQYRQLVMAAMPEAEMLDGFFRSGEVTGYRLLLVNQVAANFRLIVFREGDSPVQINYLVPRVDFPVVQKAIEASVGSIAHI